ncbi:copper resistance protein NlpE [Flavobacterium sp. I3-2]|uniref:copper resistance protein NlpE n=1 Tax=Flavobacterium sp. I3-2 TaxID=2748319 RepID=UPI0015AEF7F7|nr:copper resistance protein NlpE [Flavobacterium sp. I3-2]
MKKMILAAAVIAVGFASCDKKADANTSTNDSLNQPATTEQTETPKPTEEKPDGSTAQTALDWAGIYAGTLPCADCEGIQTELALNDDNTFVIKQTYLGKKETIEDKGTIMWHDGTIAHLKGKIVDMKLKVEENQLVFLDQDGKVIDGPLKDKYIFKKK